MYINNLPWKEHNPVGKRLEVRLGKSGVGYSYMCDRVGCEQCNQRYKCYTTKTLEVIIHGVDIEHFKGRLTVEDLFKA